MMVEHKCKFSLVGCDAKYSAKEEVAFLTSLKNMQLRMRMIVFVMTFQVIGKGRVLAGQTSSIKIEQIFLRGLFDLISVM